MNNNILEMKTLGCFSLRYNDVSLTQNARKSESHFNSIMQILIHNGENGCSKEELELLLFKDRELNNSNHTLQSVIYNTKKKLREAGLPEVDYIYQKNGIYYWNEAIKTTEDAREFERQYEEAFKADETERVPLLLEAIFIYRGDFLDNQANVVWIARESWRYKNMFKKAVKECAEILRRQENYKELEMLGKYASSVDPLVEWEELIMEAYVSQGKFSEARELYLSTSEMYLAQQDTLLSNKLGDLLNKLAKLIEYPHGYIEKIESDLYENVENDEGGFEVTFPTFVGIYRILFHILERKKQPAYLMLCTIVDSKGNLMRDTPKLAELSERLGTAIKTTIRRSDVFNKYGKAQYLVLLTNTTLENCGKIQKRINDKFIINRQRITVKYSVVNIFDTMNK